MKGNYIFNNPCKDESKSLKLQVQPNEILNMRKKQTNGSITKFQDIFIEAVIYILI